MKIQTRLLCMGAGGILATTLALIGIGAWQSHVFTMQAQTEVSRMVDEDLDHVARATYSMIQAQDQALRLQVDADLNVADHVLQSHGTLRPSDGKATWQAVNQFTKVKTPVTLPKLTVGDLWLGHNTDINAPTPVVDEIKELTGATVTIFQRMDAQGDLLRVATNVQKLDGKRAIGTFIPAVNPNGKPNTVVATVLKGQTYRGNAFVVNSWYISDYMPLFNARHEVVGALYVGIKQESVASLRQAIRDARIGKSGYIFALRGTGPDQGQYIISRNGSHDGENVWQTKDATGRPIIQKMIGEALALAPGQSVNEQYVWKDQGESGPGEKVARLVYYAPWDWVIGVTASPDDFGAFHNRLEAGRKRMLATFVALGLLLALLGAFFAWRFARSLAARLNHMVAVADGIADGEVEHQIVEDCDDEIGSLTRALRRAITYLQEMAGAASCIAGGDLTVQVQPRSERDALGQAFAGMIATLRGLIGDLSQSAATVTSASGTLVATSGQIGRAVERISLSLQDIAQAGEQSARGAEEVARGSSAQSRTVSESAALLQQLTATIGEVAQDARSATEAAARASEVAASGGETVRETVVGMETIRRTVSEAAEVIQSLGTASGQIGGIVATIDQIASQTNLLALNAAIEAARAGDAGRGFAVVAEEVRKLAERSSAATKEIGSLIEDVQERTRRAVAAIATGTREVAAEMALSEQAGNALAEIQATVVGVSARVQGIGAATAQMRAASEAVSASITKVSTVAEESSAAAEGMSRAAGEVSCAISGAAGMTAQQQGGVTQVSAAAAELQQMAEHLHSMTRRFHLDSDEYAAMEGVSQPALTLSQVA